MGVVYFLILCLFSNLINANEIYLEEITVGRQSHLGMRAQDKILIRDGEIQFNEIPLDLKMAPNYVFQIIDLKPRKSPVTPKECTDGHVSIAHKARGKVTQETVCFGTPRAEEVGAALERLHFHAKSRDGKK